MDTDVEFQEIVAAVTEMVAKQIGESAANAGPDVDLTAMDGMDSVKVLRVIAAIERKYDLEMDDEDVFACKTIHDVARCVAAALGEQVGTR